MDAVLSGLSCHARSLFEFLFPRTRRTGRWFSPLLERFADQIDSTVEELLVALHELEAAGLVVELRLPRRRQRGDVLLVVVCEALGVLPDWWGNPETKLGYSDFEWHLGEARRRDGTLVAKPRKSRFGEATGGPSKPRRPEKPSPSKTSVSDSVSSQGDPSVSPDSVSSVSESLPSEVELRGVPAPSNKPHLVVVRPLGACVRDHLDALGPEGRQAFYRALDERWAGFERHFGDRAIDELRDRIRGGIPSNPEELLALPVSGARATDPLEGRRLAERRERMLSDLREHEARNATEVGDE